MKGPDRDRLIKLFRMLGSDNPGERGNTWAIIDELLRKHRMSWNDLVELVQTAPAEPSHSADDGKDFVRTETTLMQEDNRRSVQNLTMRARPTKPWPKNTPTPGQRPFLVKTTKPTTHRS